jgi:SagB-type dehydrogenase family enzyme
MSGEQRTHRPHASGGGLHPLQLYLLCDRVANLDRAVYAYGAHDHALTFRRAPDSVFQEILTQAEFEGRPAVVILIMAEFGRTMSVYEKFGLATIYRDVGCLMQTLYLVATELGLAACASAAMHDPRNAEWLRLDPLRQGQVGAFVVGTPET